MELTYSTTAAKSPDNQALTVLGHNKIVFAHVDLVNLMIPVQAPDTLGLQAEAVLLHTDKEFS